MPSPEWYASVAKAHAVIGAGYGDEGKGLVTDWLCKGDSSPLQGPLPLVVRHNGGAQAGHTVVAPRERIRHVFSHFGSGTLAGLSSYLSPFFVCNPMIFRKELRELNQKGIEPLLYVDPACYVTTPYDMLINQALERKRGNERHGSCGIGFGETIQRSENSSAHLLQVSDLWDLNYTERTLRRILETYAPFRAKELGVSCNFYDISIDRFIQDCAHFVGNISRGQPRIQSFTPIFEGAQGLKLDQERGEFPHVTRSNTGLKNVIALAQEWGVCELDVTYVTRCYTTRHGAGPLAYEWKDDYPGEDHTNVYNEWQRQLRYGVLDIDVLARDIQQDMADLEQEKTPLIGDISVFVTCMDHIDHECIPCNVDKTQTLIPREDFFDIIQERIGCDRIFFSFGPTREEVREYHAR